jgi:hypothetical protein
MGLGAAADANLGLDGGALVELAGEIHDPILECNVDRTDVRSPSLN